MNREFATHKLNEEGTTKVHKVRNVFDHALEQLKHLCPEGREFSITKTKLEEASFFAIKAVASYPGNHPGCNDVSGAF